MHSFLKMIAQSVSHMSDRSASHAGESPAFYTEGCNLATVKVVLRLTCGRNSRFFYMAQHLLPFTYPSCQVHFFFLRTFLYMVRMKSLLIQAARRMARLIP